jgi:hypothetical protein
VNGGWRGSPNEIEQDLVKLIAFGDEPAVGSRLLMLLDSHFKSALSWAQVLVNEDMLRSRASTSLVQRLAGKIASQTQTVLLAVGDVEAALVVVDVPSMDALHEED